MQKSKLLKVCALFGAVMMFGQAAQAGAPYFGPRPAMTVNHGQNVNVDVTPVDPDGDTMTVTATGLPPGMSLAVTDKIWRVDTIIAGLSFPAIHMQYEAGGTFLVSNSSGGVYRVSLTGTETLLFPAYSANDILKQGDGSWLVTSGGHHKINKYESGQITHYAGTQQSANGSGKGHVDGSLTQARFHHPADLLRLPNGDIIVADINDRSLRKIAGGQVSTITQHLPPLSGWGGGNTPFRYAHLDYKDGYIYALDTGGNNILKIDPNNGYQETVFIDGAPSNFPSTGTAAYGLSTFVFTADGDIIFGRSGLIYKRDTNGIYEIIAGAPHNTSASYYTSTDGVSGVSRITSTQHLIKDDVSGDIYFYDGQPQSIRKLSTNPSEWALTGTYTGPNCGGNYTAMITAADSNGETTTTSVNMNIPSQGPGCSGPPGGPGGGISASTGSTPTGPGGQVPDGPGVSTGSGGRVIGGSTPISRPSTPVIVPMPSRAIPQIQGVKQKPNAPTIPPKNKGIITRGLDEDCDGTQEDMPACKPARQKPLQTKPQVITPDQSDNFIKRGKVGFQTKNYGTGPIERPIHALECAAGETKEVFNRTNLWNSAQWGIYTYLNPGLSRKLSKVRAHYELTSDPWASERKVWTTIYRPYIGPAGTIYSSVYYVSPQPSSTVLPSTHNGRQYYGPLLPNTFNDTNYRDPEVVYYDLSSDMIDTYNAAVATHGQNNVSISAVFEVPQQSKELLEVCYKPKLQRPLATILNQRR